MPSNSSEQVIWQDRREFGSTASAMSSMSISAFRRRGQLLVPAVVHIDMAGGAGAGAAAFRRDRQARHRAGFPSRSSRRGLRRMLFALAVRRDNFHFRHPELVEGSSVHTQFLLQAGRRRRVLEAQLLVRLADVERGLRHQRRLVKARQDQLQLARIGVDVADGEDARRLAFELARCPPGSDFRADCMPNSAIGPSLMVRPKKGRNASTSMLPFFLVGARKRDRIQLPVVAMQLP